MPDLSIGEVAAATGVTASAIRYYERRRLLPAPPRRHGRRCYDPSMVHRVAVIRRARQAGLSIPQLGSLLKAADATPANHIGLQLILKREIDRLNRQIMTAASLRATLTQWADCECKTPIECQLVRASAE